ncbi:unnamed protein product [Lupinus luteus]|uniref:Embryo-specific protein ATS3B n=1 Tax=Lupinus luteus TaxID=3873 RepID=A0AAV1YI22_LUPLU
MKSAANCSYMVIISTSCSSPKFTTDEISLAFGDAYGDQIYAPRLNDPFSRKFEQCSSDTFQIDGPCTYQICYAYLYRSGANENEGWKPESVKIYGFDTEPLIFDFNTPIPRDTWYGYDYCAIPTPPPPSSSYQLFTPKWVIYGVLGCFLSLWL